MKPKIKTKKEITAIEYTIELKTIPKKLYKILHSQNDLRKWWAPHVAMSHSKISQEKNKYVKMKLIQNEKDRLLRYSWRPENWEINQPNGSITFQITDLSIARDAPANEERLILDIVHDGWLDENERTRQVEIWDFAIKSLKSLVEEGKINPWWKENLESENWDQVKIQVVKKFIDDSKKTNEKYKAQILKILYQKLWMICNRLDEKGKWYIDNKNHSFMFMYQNVKIFSSNFEELTILWGEILPYSSNFLNNLKERLSVEQDLNFDFNELETPLKIYSLQTELWLAWITDLLYEIQSYKTKKAF